MKSELERIKSLYQTVLSAILVFIVAALSGYKDMKTLYSTTSHNRTHLSNLLIDELLCIITTFLFAMVLMLVEFYVSQHGRRDCGWYRVLTVLVAVRGTMLTVADTVLVIIANRSNVLLTVVLAPVLVLIGMAVHAGAKMEQPSRSTTGSRYDAAMKGTFDVANIGTMASFGLQGTVVFGYLKTPVGNQSKPNPLLDLAVCYVTSTFCLVVMMVCAMPLALLPEGMLEVLFRTVERLRRAVLAALGLMVLVVLVEFLDGFVVLCVWPEAIALVLYYAVEFFSASQRPGESLPWLNFAFRIVATVGFTLMTGLYVAFLGTDHYGVYLKAAMFVLLLAIVSSLSRLAIPFHVPDVGGAIEIGIAGVALAFPAAALLVACPLVLKVFLDLYLDR
ncbi:hypothetical protein ACP4OV_019614 [Aristida adscensionis]